MHDTIDRSLALPLAPEAKQAFAWVKDYAEEHDLSRKDLARKLSYDESTICRIYGGNYTGNPSNIVAAINTLRASLLAKIESPSEFPFVDTEDAKAVHAYIDLAAQWRKIGIVIAESQRGKTRALKQYKNEHRTIVYLRSGCAS
jgi:DNA transposition AAA+ family ATPase